MFRRSSFAIVLLLLAGLLQSAIAQVPHQILFPGTTGKALMDSLRVHYKPVSVYDYNRARDEMYRYVDNVNGVIVCLYTGQTANVSTTSTTPRADALNQNFNAEHIYPQSLGASTGNARSDLHHLRPTNANVNSSRGNLAFGFVSASQTNRWWSGTTSSLTQPSGDLSVWSRTGSTRFQPREASMGDVARAMFYFFTMYNEEALAANGVYFDNQKQALLQFHRIDPVDDQEWIRTNRVAEFQEGKINPFILDTSLAARVFFDGTDTGGGGGGDDDGDGGGDGGDDGDDETPQPATSARFDFRNTLDCQNQVTRIESLVEGLNFSHFSRQGINCNAGAGTFNSRDWSTDASANSNVYAWFSISADEGYTFKFENNRQIKVNIRRSSTGPLNLDARYSTDGVTFLPMGTASVPTADGDRLYTIPNMDNLEYIEFRFYGYGASSLNGTMRFNSVEIGFEAIMYSSVQPREASTLPSRIQLSEIYPNPFNPTGNVQVRLNQAEPLDLRVVNAMGQTMHILHTGMLQGNVDHTFLVGGDQWSSGVYFLIATGSDFREVRKMTLIK